MQTSLNKTSSGILLVDKPSNKTSSQIILEIKRKFNFQKVGHAGTLDPLATGLLVVLINKATKLSNYLLSANKEYNVCMKLFVKTDTGDILGKITEIKPFDKIAKKDFVNAFNFFNGFIYEQYPPIYSAIKYNGKKLYEYARQNVDIEIKPRKVVINKIDSLEYNKKLGLISFNVKCSKGTYIRSLVNDIAAKLNTVATVYSLRRIASGNFMIDNALVVDKLSEQNIMPIYNALLLNNYTMFQYHDEKVILQGKLIELIHHSEPYIFILNKDKKLLAIYQHIFDHKYKCVRGI